MDISRKRIAIFVGLTFLFTYGIEFFIWLKGGLSIPNIQLALMGIMLIPAMCSILTRRLTNEGRADLWLNPNLRRNYKPYLAAWFLPIVFIAVGALLYFLIFPDRYDPEFSLIRNSMALLDPNGKELTQSDLINVILMQLGSAVLLAPVLNFIPSLGEELGWRGYLFPKLIQVTSRKMAVILSGVIWGLWHAPLIAMGYNYGFGYRLFPLPGILGMILYCFLVGAFMCYLTLKTGSVLAATIVHGASNGAANSGILFLNGTLNPFIGPLPIGIIGGIGWIIAGLWAFFKIDNLKLVPEEIESGSDLAL